MRLRKTWKLLVLALGPPVTASAQQSQPAVQFATTETLTGCTISHYRGVVAAAPQIGGGRAPSQKEFSATYQAAMTALGEQAKGLGANWILKLEFTVIYGYDRDGPATGHFPQRLSAVGTAVQATCP
jgi:uncharacterized protein YbjQ (UPF0145 family)